MENFENHEKKIYISSNPTLYHEAKFLELTTSLMVDTTTRNCEPTIRGIPKPCCCCCCNK